MAYLPREVDNLTYVKTQNNFKKLNILDEKDDANENIQNNSMLNIMSELITTMNQLQKMFIEQISTQQNIEKNIPDNQKEKNINIENSVPSQTELLLQQVQNAMESTIAQLSNRDRAGNINPAITDSPNKMDDDNQLSISEKWRLYTEMYQSRNECSKEYCINKMKLGQELGLNFKETKREMLIGLWSNRLSIVLHLKQHETEEDLLNDIEDWERIEKARSEVFKKYRHKKNN